MEPTVSFSHPAAVDVKVDVVVVGAGACGLVAALRAKEAGANVLIVERDAAPTGSTSMSSGFVPAPGTRFQRAIGVVDDTPDRFVADLVAKSKGLCERSLTRLAADTIGKAMEWLADKHGMEWIVLDDFLYPNHSRHRMHAVPEKTGSALLARLLNAVEKQDIPIVTEARAQTLFVPDAKTITAIAVSRPDGKTEVIGTDTLVLACNGYGGKKEMIAKYIPEISKGVYHGHAGNTGDAVRWGEQLGARIMHLSGYQGHGSLAHPHGILITWALMMEGGIQVNMDGKRFSNEHGGYSEQAVHVLAQPGAVAWNVYDQRIHDFALSFPDYVEAVEAGAIKQVDDLDRLAELTGTPLVSLQETMREISKLHSSQQTDKFGRSFHEKQEIAAPYFAVKVTGALFHTQGGLMINDKARVLDSNLDPFPNLYAGGGAACGVSGPDVSGYLSGNGLLTAIAFGYLAGMHCSS